MLQSLSNHFLWCGFLLAPRLFRTVCSFLYVVSSLSSKSLVSFERVAPVFSNPLVLFERFAPVFSSSLASSERFAPCSYSFYSLWSLSLRVFSNSLVSSSGLLLVLKFSTLFRAAGSFLSISLCLFWSGLPVFHKIVSCFRAVCSLFSNSLVSFEWFAVSSSLGSVERLEFWFSNTLVCFSLVLALCHFTNSRPV